MCHMLNVIYYVYSSKSQIHIELFVLYLHSLFKIWQLKSQEVLPLAMENGHHHWYYRRAHIIDTNVRFFINYEYITWCIYKLLTLTHSSPLVAGAGPRRTWDDESSRRIRVLSMALHRWTAPKQARRKKNKKIRIKKTKVSIIVRVLV